MAISTKLYVRVVSQDRGRGFMLLAGYDAKLVQTTAAQITTLSGVTRQNLTAAIDRIAKVHSASEVQDVTAPGVLRQLRVRFHEPHPMTQKQLDAVTRKAMKAMKARVGDFIKTENGPSRVIKADPDNGYELENGYALADADISADDVLLESEVV